MTRPFALICALLVPATLIAADPRISNLDAELENGGVTVRFQLENAFARPEVELALKSGLATGFVYTAELVRHRPNWFDDTIASTEIEIVCAFNSRTQEYLLNHRRDRRLVSSETFGDLAALKKRMTTIDEHGLFDTRGYKPHKLRVRVKADLGRGYLLYIIPRNVGTDWKEARVRTE